MIELSEGQGLPVPVSDERNRPFWDGAAEERFLLPRCAECRQLLAPPVANCSVCLGDRFDWVAASGRGTIYSFIEYQRSWIRPFDNRLPYTVAIVALDEGPRMISLLVGQTKEWVRIGAAVRVVFQQRGEGTGVPVFTEAVAAQQESETQPR